MATSTTKQPVKRIRRMYKRKSFFLYAEGKGIMFKDEKEGYNFAMKGSAVTFHSLVETKCAIKLFKELGIAEDLTILKSI